MLISTRRLQQLLDKTDGQIGPYKVLPTSSKRLSVDSPTYRGYVDFEFLEWVLAVGREDWEKEFDEG